jgi:hypothetical protein
VTVADSARRWTSLAICLVLATAAVVTSMATPAPAAPGDSEGGSAALASALENASRGFTDARGKLAASRRRQAELTARQRLVQQQVVQLGKDVNQFAAAAYRGGNLGAINSILSSDGLDDYLARAGMLQEISRQNSVALDRLNRAEDELETQNREIGDEIRLQQVQEQQMAKRKSDAERALNVTSDEAAFLSGSAPRAARSAPRRADGSFAPQSCSIKDPTSSGCLTPRALNALQQAKAAGFTHFVACFRSASFGEHPKGRACDFAANARGFAGVAAGAEKEYGNRLANYFIANSDRLGVLYVIWFRRIWLPGVGWRAYTRGDGTPSSDHTNHVHLSVQ